MTEPKPVIKLSYVTGLQDFVLKECDGNGFKILEKEGDSVYTHNNRWRKVRDVLKREYHSKIYKIRPWYFSAGLTPNFQGLTTSKATNLFSSFL